MGKTAKRKIIGGKRDILASGAYGCVINDAFRCKGDKTVAKGLVSKLMEPEDAEVEYQNALVMSKIDKNQKYTLPLPQKCKIDTTDITNEERKRLEKCSFGSPVSDKILDSIEMLNMKNGGNSLSDIADKVRNGKIKWLDCILAFENLFEGVVEFFNNRYIHNDIKPGNIVGETVNGKLTLKFIDLGLSISDYTKNINSMGLFHFNYPFERGFIKPENFGKFKRILNQVKPPTFTALLNEFDTTRDENREIVKKHTLETFSNYIFVDEQDRLKFQQKLNNFYEIKFPDYSNQINSYEELVQSYYSTVDVYGLGYSLMFFLLNSISISIFNVFIESNSSKYDPQLSDTLFNFCYEQLINPDYKLRLRPQQALIKFRQIIQPFK